MFDKNPKSTPADKYVAGKTTEQVVRAVAPVVADPKSPGLVTDGGATIPAMDILAALVARFDRKAEAREAKSAA